MNKEQATRLRKEALALCDTRKITPRELGNRLTVIAKGYRKHNCVPVIKEKRGSVLETFVKHKEKELKEKYRFVAYQEAESVMLTKNGVVSNIDTLKTSRTQRGREVALSELEVIPTTPFVPNGSIVKFLVKQPRKRKAESVEYYFLWMD